MGKKKIFSYFIGTVFLSTIALFYNNCSAINLMGGKITSQSVAPPTEQGPDPRADTVTYSNLNNPDSSTAECWGSMAIVNALPPTPKEIPYLGKTYPLTIITSGATRGAAVDCSIPNLLNAQLDPLSVGSSEAIRFISAQGIYSFRFKTPAEATKLMITFLVYSGNSQGGKKNSISKNPGEFYNDGRENSSTYCDKIDGNYTSSLFYTNISDQAVSTPGACSLLQNSYYYFNVLIDYDPFPYNTSSFSIRASIPASNP